MSSKLLYIFVEGPDDERFFQHVFLPTLYQKGYTIFIIKYAQKKNVLVKKYIKKIESKPNQDYIFVADLDSHKFPCITSCKLDRVNGYDADDTKVIVVKEEIESWYLAGTTKYSSGISNTDSLTKEMFEEMIPDEFADSNDFMIEILKEYDLKTASAKNSSLNYFINDYHRKNFSDPLIT